MRVVFDSSIFVSALTLPDGKGDAAVAAVLTGKAVVLLSEPMLGEVLGVLGRKFAYDREQLARVALFLSELAEHVAPRGHLTVLQDEPDNRILECAVAGRADSIVTGDRQMLRLGRYEGIEIVSLRVFLDRLDQAR